MPFTTSLDASVRPYILTEYTREWRVVRVRAYRTLGEMAIAAWGAADKLAHNRSWWPYAMDAVTQTATSTYGKQYNVAELVPWGRKLWWNNVPSIGPWRQPEFRRGPWPNIHKMRGGWRASHPKVQAEQRLNASVLLEEGEVSARPSRGRGYMPTDRDRRWTDRGGRGWKNQHKGVKSWDRPEQHGKAG